MTASDKIGSNTPKFRVLEQIRLVKNAQQEYPVYKEQNCLHSYLSETLEISYR